MKDKLGIGIAVVALVLGAIAFLSVGKTIVMTQDGPKVGAVPTLTSPQEWNGVTMIHERRTFRSGTSTVVSFKPAATSTLTLACKGGAGLSFAQEYEIAVGQNTNSTSTFSLGKMYIPANGSDAVVATTTSYVFEPTDIINVKMATTSGTTVSTALAPTGSCDFVGFTI